MKLQTWSVVLYLASLTTCVIPHTTDEYYLNLLYVNQKLNTHFEQKQQADGTWDLQVYGKQAIGSYDKHMASKSKAWKVCGWSAAVMVASAIGLIIVAPKEQGKPMNHPAALPLAFGGLGGFLTLAFAGVSGLESKNNTDRYQKEYIAKDAHGNPLDEKYEYYLLCKKSGLKDKPITAQPTITTIYAQAQKK